MLEMYTLGTFATDATDPRNLFHEHALHEARIATDYREGHATAQPRTSSLVARLRAALSGAQVAPATQACNCPA